MKEFISGVSHSLLTFSLDIDLDFALYFHIDFLKNLILNEKSTYCKHFERKRF